MTLYKIIIINLIFCWFSSLFISTPPSPKQSCFILVVLSLYCCSIGVARSLVAVKIKCVMLCSQKSRVYENPSFKYDSPWKRARFFSSLRSLRLMGSTPLAGAAERIYTLFSKQLKKRDTVSHPFERENIYYTLRRVEREDAK